MPDFLGRAGQLGRNAVLLGSTAVRHAVDDPLLLLVQGSRRLPARLRRPVAAALAAGAGVRPTVRGALSAFVADRPDDARAVLRAVRPRGRLGQRLAAELAVQLGADTHFTGGAVTQARARRRAGDLTGAVDLLAAHRVAPRSRARLAAELRTMQPGFQLSAPQLRARPRPSGAPRALHVLTNSLPHTRSGYAIRSHAVLTGQRDAGIAVAAVTRIGYPVTVGLAGARSTDVVDGVPYHRVLPARMAGAADARLAQMAQAVAAHADRHGATVLHTTTNFANALVTEAVARAAGVPWVYEARGQLEKTWVASRPPAERADAEASERYRLLRAKETEMMLAADFVVTLSETMRHDFIDRGVPADRIAVVPNGVDARALGLELRPEEARERLSLPVEGFWVGTVSSLVDYEGLDALLDAIAQLRAGGLDVRGAIVGDGVCRPSLEAQADRLGLRDAVLFPGRVAPEDTLLWHRALDVFAVPRRDAEVCRAVTPLKPVEAMAAGRPVVASALPALAEIVDQPGTGILVPPGDSAALADTVARLRSDRALAAGYGIAGRRFAATRTWQAAGARYRGIYEHLEARA